MLDHILIVLMALHLAADAYDTKEKKWRIFSWVAVGLLYLIQVFLELFK